jgi:hypothetical protein
MTTTSLPAACPSTAEKAPVCQVVSGSFSQIELPFQRERDTRKGSFYRNCRFVEAIRRSVTKRLSSGAAQKMAESLNQFDDLPRVVARIHDEHSGQTRYSLDVFIAALINLSSDDARHVLGKIARPLGFWVAPLPCSAGEESAS